MRANTRYGKLGEDGKVVYAPSVLRSGRGCVINPCESKYLDAGWLKIVDDKPQCTDSDSYYSRAGWHIDNNARTLTALYELHKVMQPPQQKKSFVRRALRAIALKVLEFVP